jgi:hypothetical protein
MMNKAPCSVPAPEPDQSPNELKSPELLTVRPKATFQWPPDCVWPFLGQDRDGEA